ncbi:conserved hypothetical protein [Ricinus communis]|uniref:Uncharacterized protein n=1 Tax=Ricinus communis TaxID=3988 RepID=B9TB89_RICCO|nr:conserved hypothetical protein [Ricinus communis]
MKSPCGRLPGVSGPGRMARSSHALPPSGQVVDHFPGGLGGHGRRLHREQMAAGDNTEMAPHQRLGVLVAGLAGFPGIVAADEADRHRIAAAQQFRQVVRQRGVDRRLVLAREAQLDALLVRLEAAVHVIGQHAGRPGREQVLGGEVLIRRAHVRPDIAAADGELGRRHAVSAPQQLDHAPGERAPAADHRRIEHHHAAHQVGPLVSHHQAQHAAQRMADQDHRLAVVAAGQLLDIFVDQVWPAVGDRVAGIVGMHVERLDVEMLGQQREELAVHARRAIKKNLPEIDKEIRGKAPAVPEARPDNRYTQLSKAMERGYVGSNPNDARGYYVSPEGITYYTETLHGQTRCWMQGPVNSPAGHSNGALSINCPANTTWKKY